MESIICNVRDIDASARQMLEHVLGRQLKDDQQVIIQVVTLPSAQAEKRDGQDVSPSKQLPDWCNVYAGLTDAQVAEVEEVILRRCDLTRPCE